MQSLTLTYPVLNGLKLLSREEAGAALFLLNDYVQDGKKPETENPKIEMFLSFAVAEIDKMRFYRESGKKGGRPKKEKTNEPPVEIREPPQKNIVLNPKKTEKREYGAFCLSGLVAEKNDNGGLTGVFDNKTGVSDKNKKEKSPQTPIKENNIIISQKRNTDVFPKKPFSFDEIARWWNDEIVPKFGVSTVVKKTSQRSAALAVRINEAGSVERFKEIISTSFSNSGFLRGENASGWRADFDFCLQSKSFTKMSEGGYNDAKKGASYDGYEGIPL